MSGLRALTADEQAAPAECGRCRATGCPWDRVGGVPVCPDCQEMLVRGEGEPLALRVQPGPCAACGAAGSVPFVTVPLQAKAVALDLCPAHLRALLGRGLDRSAFLQLARLLQTAGLAPGRVFLLHEAFYDRQGRALQPVREPA